MARGAERSYGPEQLAWTRRLKLERDNVRLALNTAIETNDGSLAVRLLASHPNRHGVWGANPVGAVLSDAVDQVLELEDARDSPEYPRGLMVAAYQTFWSGDCDYAVARELCSEALTEQQDRAVAPQGPPIEMDARILGARLRSFVGVTDAVHAYSQAAEAARADGYPGIAATYLAFGVNARVLSGLGAEEAIAEAEDAVALARESGMPGAIVQSLTTLALALAEHDPLRARGLLDESIEYGGGEAHLRELRCLLDGRGSPS